MKGVRKKLDKESDRPRPLRKKNINRAMKKICLKTFVRSVVLHGSKTWVINETETISVEAYGPPLIRETRPIMNTVERR